MVLTDEERAKIKAEEEFRHELKMASAAQPSRANKLLSLLSTPFVLWFLSSVVLYLISIGYADFNARLAQRAAFAELVGRLATEFDVRLEHATLGLSVVGEGRGNSTILAPTRGTYREFDNTDMISLASRLSRVCGDRVPESKELYAAMVRLVDVSSGRESEELVKTAREHIETGRRLVAITVEACLAE